MQGSKRCSSSSRSTPRTRSAPVLVGRSGGTPSARYPEPVEGARHICVIDRQGASRARHWPEPVAGHLRRLRHLRITPVLRYQHVPLIPEIHGRRTFHCRILRLHPSFLLPSPIVLLPFVKAPPAPAAPAGTGTSARSAAPSPSTAGPAARCRTRARSAASSTASRPRSPRSPHPQYASAG